MEYAGKETTTRLIYPLTNNNLKWINTDIEALKCFLSIYPKMKKPFILLLQQGIFFQQNNFVWPPLNKDILDKMNKASILSERTLITLSAWLKKTSYTCLTPQKEITILPDGMVRLCLSHQINKILGDLNKQSLNEILETSKAIREEASNCPYRENCWLMHHYKDNIMEKINETNLG